MLLHHVTLQCSLIMLLHREISSYFTTILSDHVTLSCNLSALPYNFTYLIMLHHLVRHHIIFSNHVILSCNLCALHHNLTYLIMSHHHVTSSYNPIALCHNLFSPCLTPSGFVTILCYLIMLLYHTITSRFVTNLPSHDNVTPPHLITIFSHHVIYHAIS